MMGFLKAIEAKMQKMNMWEFALFKTTIALAGIIIGAFIAGFVKLYLWYFVALFVVLYVWLLIRVFGK